MARLLASVRQWDVVAGVLFLLAALILFTWTESMEARWLRAAGTVAALESRSCAGGTCSCAVVAFADARGEQRLFTSAYCRRAQDYYGGGLYWPGTSVSVLYDPTDASWAAVADDDLMYRTPRGLAIIGALCLVPAALGRRRRRALLREL